MFSKSILTLSYFSGKDDLYIFAPSSVYEVITPKYLLYKDDVYFGGIFDDRLLVKMTKSVEKYAMSEQLPYEGAKPMYLVDCVDEQDKLCAIISEVTEDLKKNTKKKK